MNRESFHLYEWFQPLWLQCISPAGRVSLIRGRPWSGGAQCPQQEPQEEDRFRFHHEILLGLGKKVEVMYRVIHHVRE